VQIVAVHRLHVQRLDPSLVEHTEILPAAAAAGRQPRVSGGFKRSSRFGIVGLFAAAGLCVLIALTTGQGEANPKLTLGLIFAVPAVYFVILFALQRSDVERSAGGDARATERAVAEGGRAVENPMTIGEPELWAAMAIAPIDADAIRARSEMWGAGRSSLRRRRRARRGERGHGRRAPRRRALNRGRSFDRYPGRSATAVGDAGAL
jgi:hypothetical protein